MIGGQGEAKEDIRNDNGLLLLDRAEWVFLLVFSGVQSIIPQLWKTKRTD